MPSITIAINDAGMTVNDINEIVFVGDFSKNAMMVRMIDNMFKDKNIRQHHLVSHYLASYGAALESSVV